MEPIRTEKTESDYPPNFREVKCCASCKHGVGWDECSCHKYYSAPVSYYNLCDDYEPEE